MKPSRKNTKKTTVRRIMKLIKTNYKEKIFRAARKKKKKQTGKLCTDKNKDNKDKNKTDFFLETMQVKRQKNNKFKALGKKHTTLKLEFYTQ